MQNNLSRSNPSMGTQRVPSLLKQITQYVPGAIVPAVFGMLSSAVFTRVFGSAEYGQYSLAIGVGGLGAAISGQWLVHGINRYLPGVSDPAERSQLKRAIALSLLGIGMVLLVVGALAWAPLRLTSNNWRSFLWPTVLLVIASALFSPIAGVFQAEGKPRRYSAYQLYNVILRLGLSLSIVFAVSRNPVSLVWGSAAAIMLILPLMWRETDMPDPISLVRGWRSVLPSIRKMVVYGWPMVGWFLAGNVLAIGDRYVIQWFRGAGEVGVYSANYSLVTGAIGLIASPIALAAHPALMKAWDQGDLETAGRWLGTVLEWFFFLGFLMVGGMAVFARDIANLILGEQFHTGYRILPVVLAGVVAMQLSMYAHKPLEFVGKTPKMFVMHVVAAVFNLVLNMLLIPKWGYQAAAYTTLASYLFYAGMVGVAGRSILPWRLRWGRIALALLISCAGFSLASLARLVVEGLGHFYLGLAVAVIMSGGTVGLVSAVALRGFLKQLLNRGRSVT